MIDDFIILEKLVNADKQRSCPLIKEISDTSFIQSYKLCIAIFKIKFKLCISIFKITGYMYLVNNYTCISITYYLIKKISYN